RGNQAYEILVDPEPDAGALLGVELGREDVLVGHDRGERDAVVGLADDHRRIGRIDVIRVPEVEVLLAADTFHHRMACAAAPGVPAAVGPLWAAGQASHGSRDQAETGHARAFFA